MSSRLSLSRLSILSTRIRGRLRRLYGDEYTAAPSGAAYPAAPLNPAPPLSGLVMGCQRSTDGVSTYQSVERYRMGLRTPYGDRVSRRRGSPCGARKQARDGRNSRGLRNSCSPWPWHPPLPCHPRELLTGPPPPLRGPPPRRGRLSGQCRNLWFHSSYSVPSTGIQGRLRRLYGDGYTASLSGAAYTAEALKMRPPSSGRGTAESGGGGPPVTRGNRPGG